MVSRLYAIRDHGQRIWLDNLSRELLASGQLAEWLRADGIAGVTSNPAIFHKAISQDVRYRNDVAALRQTDLSPEARYEALVLPDIRQACDLLRASYDATHGEDGYVSLEVSPFLAHDEAGTLAAARRLWLEVGRPNVMIKIPATPAGIAALRILTEEGININVTLLFSARQVEAVWDAYLAGLAAREADERPVHGIKAVASFFLSRIDTLLDPKLPSALQGQTAIALAKTVYQRYRERFHGAEFAPLRAVGARPQYLLWASTGTKNPAYSDVLYVENLIGAETVNTVPDATLAAFRAHGEVCASIERGLSAAQAQLHAVAQVGVEMEQVGEQLQQQGLALFDDAYRALLDLLA